MGTELSMKSKCEKCEANLGLEAAAFICSYECTFCPACSEKMENIRPNCGVELVCRPKPEVET
jgi:hypothetical protein